MASAEPQAAWSGLPILVFTVVVAAFTNYYLPQPVLPVLQEEFGVSASLASWSVSSLILGVTLANLPFGRLADRLPIRPLLLCGGLVVAGAGLICAVAPSLWLLVAARFVQGLFLPALTTCLAALLARTLPLESLNVAMGAYVSATVAGGLLGRLLGGWIHDPLHWRWAFVSASLLLLVSALWAWWRLPREEAPPTDTSTGHGFWELLRRPECLRLYLVGLGAFFIFSSLFNYLPFHLAGPPFNASTNLITSLYLSYLVGLITGPLAGRLSNRLGSGAAMALGSLILALAILLTLLPWLWSTALALALVCLGFFTVHASAAGALNRRLSGGQGRANSLYVLFYYAGGWLGITLAGQAWEHFGWLGVATQNLAMLALPLAVGLWERKHRGKAG